MTLKNALTLLIFALFGASTLTSFAQTGTLPFPSLIRVAFANPEKFRDIGSTYVSSGKVREDYLEQLRKHLLLRAGPIVSNGQQLSVTITDVDMAGGFEPWRVRLADVRIVRDVYPPRINLNFKLTDAGGTVIKQGERKLRNPAFLMTAVAYRDAPLRHEKALLDDWLERDFPRS